MWPTQYILKKFWKIPKVFLDPESAINRALSLLVDKYALVYSWVFQHQVKYLESGNCNKHEDQFLWVLNESWLVVSF